MQSDDVLRQRAPLQDARSKRALDGANIPTSVYTRLIDGVNRGLPTFHRYLQLRKRMMELPELHYYDLYAPLVASVDLSYTAEEAQKNVLAALAPLGPDYAAARRTARSTSAGSTSIRPKASARAPIRTAAPTTCTRTC